MMKGLATISAGSLRCKFVGLVGADPTGAEYRTKLAAQGVEPLLMVSPPTPAVPNCLPAIIMMPTGFFAATPPLFMKYEDSLHS